MAAALRRIWAARPSPPWLLSLVGAAKPTLEAAEASLTPVSDIRLSAVVSTAPSARGAPFFDRQGGLVAVLAAPSGPPKRLAGVVLAEPHEAIGVPALKAFLGPAVEAEAAGNEGVGAAELARRMRGAIVAVYCAP